MSNDDIDNATVLYFLVRYFSMILAHLSRLICIFLHIYIFPLASIYLIRIHRYGNALLWFENLCKYFNGEIISNLRRFYCNYILRIHRFVSVIARSVVSTFHLNLLIPSYRLTASKMLIGMKVVELIPSRRIRDEATL